MTDVRVITTDGGDKILESAAVEKFADGLRGRLVQPGEGGYDEARRVWNGMIDRHPALIARCAGPADVMAAVRFARDHRLLVSVKGGGHNITGNAVCEGGLMLDLSGMKSVRVDPVGAYRARRSRPDLGRVQPRDPGLWARQHRRRRVDDRHCRVDLGRRARLDDGQARAQLR